MSDLIVSHNFNVDNSTAVSFYGKHGGVNKSRSKVSVGRTGDKTHHCRAVSSLSTVYSDITMSIDVPATPEGWPFDSYMIAPMIYSGDSSMFPSDKFICVVLQNMVPPEHLVNVVSSPKYASAGMCCLSVTFEEVLTMAETSRFKVVVLCGVEMTATVDDFSYLLPFVDNIKLVDNLWRGNLVSPIMKPKS